MSLAWIERKQEMFNPTVFLNRFKSIAKDAGDKIEFQNYDGFEAFEMENILSEQIAFDPVVPDTERGRICRNAVIECVKAKNFDQGFFLQAASTHCSEYLGRPEQSYLFYSSLSLCYDVNLIALELDHCTFTFLPRLPAEVDRSPLEYRIHSYFGNVELPEDYLCVRITTRGRTHVEAGSRAAQSLALLRSIWNFNMNLFRGTTVYAGKGPPITNKIVEGPIATLHREDDSLIQENFWGDLEYRAPSDLLPAEEFLAETLQNNIRCTFDRLIACPFRESMENAFRRYGRALDRIDYDVAILELWSVLEMLTESSARYERIVNRVAFLMKDVSYQKLRLNHVRNYRNKVVHSGHSSRAKDQTIHIARFYVERLILHLLNNPSKANTLTEAAEFLDHPADIEILEAQEEKLMRKAHLTNLAKNFRCGGG